MGTEAFRLVERVPAGAGAAGVGIIDGKPLGFDRVCEVDARTGQVRQAHFVYYKVDPSDKVDFVAVQATVVEVELVAESGAATGLDGDAQR